MIPSRYLGLPRAVPCFLPAVFFTLILWVGAPSRESAGSDFQLLKQFTTAEGAHPFSEPVLGSDGALYGTTVTGNSSTDHDTIYKMNTDGTGFTVLMNFDSPTTGGNCWGGLLLGSDGVLYGTTFTGGAGGTGTVFKVNEDGTDFTVLKDFDAATTGGRSYARLLEVDKVLYGTAYLGGNSNAGTVFKLNMDGSDFAVLKHFDSLTTGGLPVGGLVLGPDGALYGMAYFGGDFAYGTIYRLEPRGTFTVLKHLDQTTGIYPQTRLLSGTDGALYGMAAGGGSYDAGTLFTIAPDGTGFTVLKNLSSSADGDTPLGGLTEGDGGKLYGTTLRGGRYDWGTVFEMNSDGSGFRVLKRLNYTVTGGALYAGLIRSNGVLYGAASYGGDGDEFGTLFRLVPAANLPPTAFAGADQTLVVVNEIVTLDGSFSSDPDDDDLTYAWTLGDIPRGSAAELTDPETVHPTLKPDTAGDYTVVLTVTDSLGAHSHEPATVTITAIDPE
jgi:uncharacterized repeat protein (TIGR03803 family)